MNRIPPTSALVLLASALVMALFVFHLADWGHGIIRTLLMLLLLAGVSSLPWCVRACQIRRQPDAPPFWIASSILLVLLALEVALGCYSTARTARTGRIWMDQGQNTHRSALLWMRGENPYAYGQLLDLDAYWMRRHERAETGAWHLVNEREVDLLYDGYWETLDPNFLRLLLPLPGPDAPPEAHREAAILGYKYGPVLFVLAALPVRMFGPAAIPLLNLLAFIGWMVALAVLLRSSRLPRWTWTIVLASVLAISHVPVNFLLMTASDVWPLLFTTIALVALYRKWPVVLGIALGMALASKIFPAILFVPLLVIARSWRAAIIALVMMGAAYVPFVLSDPLGVYYNVVRWSSLMKPDTTGWAFYAPAWLVVVGRGAVAVGIIWVWYRLMAGREQRLFFALATVNLLLVLGGAAFHNNYVTWFVPWLFLAAAEAVSRTATVPRFVHEPMRSAAPALDHDELDDELSDLDASPG